jgi:hypothetical protein
VDFGHKCGFKIAHCGILATLNSSKTGPARFTAELGSSNQKTLLAIPTWNLSDTLYDQAKPSS